MTSDKNHATKVRIAKQLEKLAHEHTPLSTYTEGFVKNEVEYGEGWPRLVSARTEVVRQLDAVPYKLMEKHLYQDECFLKK